MAYSIEDVAAITGQAAQARARNTGLEEQFARAQVLRDEARPSRTENPLAQLARFTRNSRGQKQARELRPDLDANRIAMGQGDVAENVYGLERAKAKVDQDQSNWQGTADAKVLQASVLAKATKQQRDRQQDNWQSEQSARAVRDAQSQSNWQAKFDRAGEEHAAALQTELGNLDPNKPEVLKETTLKTGLKDLRKDIKVWKPVVGAIDHLDSLLKPYSKGQEREGEGIGGVGGIGGATEGVMGYVGDAWRWMDDATTFGEGRADSADISAAITGVVAPIVRAHAGSAQTVSESMKVIRRFGLQTISDEKTFLKAYPILKIAIQEDAGEIKSGTLQGVLDYYEKQGGKFFKNQPKVMDFSNREGIDAPKQTQPGTAGFSIRPLD